jgi:hypothetical protein
MSCLICENRKENMLRVLFLISAVACLPASANAHGGHQSTSINGTSFNGMSMQGIELQGMSLQGMNLQGVNMQGREIGATSTSPIVEEISLPTGEKFDLR